MTDQQFTDAITEHRPALVAYARARGYADAEDTVQDVLAAIWARKAHHEFREDAGVYTWLCQCVKQRAIDLLRLRDGPARHEDRVGYVNAQDEMAAEGALRERARELIATVADPIVQQALELWCDGCTWREIAIAVDATPETVRKWVREAFAELAKDEEVFA